MECTNSVYLYYMLLYLLCTLREMLGSRRLCSAREFYLVPTVCFLLQIHADQPTTYQYLVKFISPTKKSKYITRVWHGVDCVFESLTELQEKLIEDFLTNFLQVPHLRWNILRKRTTLRGG